MKRPLLISIAWLALTASVASAGGIKLAWNDCLGAGGVTNRTFACDTNVGSNDLCASFDPTVDLPDVNGLNVTIYLFDLSSATLPAWWKFKNAGSCRLSSLSAQTIAGSCASVWGQPSPAVAGIAAYITNSVIPSIAPNMALILGSVSAPSAAAAPVHPGTEYTALVIRIDNTKTTGLGACGGCQDEIYLALREILLTTNNSGDYSWRIPDSGIYPGAPDISVYWQGPSTPTLNRTWGQLKSLYR